MRTRLDAVVKVREREEDRALEQVAHAEAKAKAAVEHARAMAAATKIDQRRAGDVSTWELAEVAHVRALTVAHRAQKDSERAQAEVAKVRVLYTSAHQQAEVVRRAAEHRRDEARREADRVEDKSLDEVASMLWFRRAG